MPVTRRAVPLHDGLPLQDIPQAVAAKDNKLGLELSWRQPLLRCWAAIRLYLAGQGGCEQRPPTGSRYVATGTRYPNENNREGGTSELARTRSLTPRE